MTRTPFSTKARRDRLIGLSFGLSVVALMKAASNAFLEHCWGEPLELRMKCAADLELRFGLHVEPCCSIVLIQGST
jgi:hypothetical protein